MHLSAPAIELARRNLTHAGLPATLEIMDGEMLRMGDDSFDVVYAQGVIHYTATSIEFLKMFQALEIVQADQEYYRAPSVGRDGLKVALCNSGFRPINNLILAPMARKYTYTLSATALKQ
jgi:hypothetical protein